MYSFHHLYLQGEVTNKDPRFCSYHHNYIHPSPWELDEGLLKFSDGFSTLAFKSFGIQNYITGGVCNFHFERIKATMKGKQL